MTPTDQHDARIEYTVKELLERIDKQQTAEFARLKEQLAQKADKADVDTVNRRLELQGERIGRLEESERSSTAATKALAAHKDTRETRQRWIIGTAVTVGLLVATFLPYLFPHR